jgi:hypothetical protein
MPPPQLNVEYWFRLLYECFHGGCYGNGSVDSAQFGALLANLWLWIIFVGYLVAVIALIIIIYTTIRLFELRKREEEYYGTLLIAHDTAEGMNPRWRHIETLRDSDNPNDWRTAIMEADIMLDDMLLKQGYDGVSVAEKLKQIEPSDFASLEDAWEAHKIRNQIAHQGTTFDLSEQLARRTIARYEAVFKEFKIL